MADSSFTPVKSSGPISANTEDVDTILANGSRLNVSEDAEMGNYGASGVNLRSSNRISTESETTPKQETDGKTIIENAVQLDEEEKEQEEVASKVISELNDEQLVSFDKLDIFSKMSKRLTYEDLVYILIRQICVEKYYKIVLPKLRKKVNQQNHMVKNYKEEMKQLLKKIITLEMRHKMLKRTLKRKRLSQMAKGPINWNKNRKKIIRTMRASIPNVVAIGNKSKKKSQDADLSYHFPTSIPVVGLNAESASIIDLTQEDDDDSAVVDQAHGVSSSNGQIPSVKFDTTRTSKSAAPASPTD